jgi:MoaA/NifB/PqqE/SkfB family radical SAM enzyme
MMGLSTLARHGLHSGSMVRRIGTEPAPARARVGLPVVPDGTRRHPLLLRLPDGDRATCNNGCDPCVSRAVEAPSSDFASDVRGQHVVLRDREAALRADLPGHVRALRDRGAASIALLTNGRILLYPERARSLVRAGVDRFVVKLFGLDAASHDAHTRAPGSFDQALRGIEIARREPGTEVVVTFPQPIDTSDDAERRRIRDARAELARSLTARDPVEMPEPEVESHPNEYRYDVVVLREGIRFSHPHWTSSFFPMVHLNTGPICNIRCVYCNVHGGDDQRLYDVEYVERLMDDAMERVLVGRGHLGVPTIDFIGGEPTMHPELPRLVAMAREKGFGSVFICTNGMRLLRPGYLRSLIDAGLTGVRFSFHDHRPEVANALADVPGLGDKYVEVAEALLASKELHTHLFRIILSSTIDALPDYVRWIAAHNRTGRAVDLAFGMPSMRGRLFENRHVYPELAALRPAVSAAIALARELGIEPMIHHAPACLHPEDPGRAACTHVTTMQFDAMLGSETVMNFEGEAIHGEACERCPARTEGCAGLPRAYFDADRAAAEAWLVPITFPPERRA